VFKIVLRFRNAFWQEEGFVAARLAEHRAHPADFAFVHAHNSAVPTWWTAVPSRAPVLTGWAGGPKAEALLGTSEQERLGLALGALAEVLAVPRALLDDRLESFVAHDWAADPFSRGAYTYPAIGGVSAQKALAKAVKDTLFFAGEATDPEQTATVAGAIASGHRAARQVVAAFGVGR
jgi:monoamine oxidase